MQSVNLSAYRPELNIAFLLELIFESIRDLLHYALGVLASILIKRRPHKGPGLYSYLVAEFGKAYNRCEYLGKRSIESRCLVCVAGGLSAARSTPIIGYGPSVKNGGSMVEIGKEAPNFILEVSESHLVRLEDFRGKKVVLWFYPKDDTPG